MSKKNGNKPEEKIPTGKELLKMFPTPKTLTAQEQALLESTRAAMKALDERIKKYGNPPDFRH
ncbi:MAG TPA: hypothetical protein PKE69_00885 [Pyrinomonadaceae bacterium]|nr:hypothetical protein [Pyrinomonadaceae bacterium]